MDGLIEIKARTKTGNTQTFHVAAILEIDGKPYQPAESYDDLRSNLIHMDGRLTAIETILSKGN